jgi:hypothetical protein
LAWRELLLPANQRAAIDVFARRIVGWCAAASLRTDFVLDALEQAIYHRGGAGVDDLVHQSDRGTQYLSIRYTERLAEAGIAPSVGSRGDSYGTSPTLRGGSSSGFRPIALGPRTAPHARDGRDANDQLVSSPW